MQRHLVRIGAIVMFPLLAVPSAAQPALTLPISEDMPRICTMLYHEFEHHALTQYKFAGTLRDGIHMHRGRSEGTREIGSVVSRSAKSMRP